MKWRLPLQPTKHQVGQRWSDGGEKEERAAAAATYRRHSKLTNAAGSVRAEHRDVSSDAQNRSVSGQAV